MFDVAPSELLVVAVVALLVIGPKDLPKAMRFVGYWVGRARGVARQFRSGFDNMIREAELAELEKQWKSENERIMREHPASAVPALAHDTSEPDAPPAEGHVIDATPDGAPVMTARPVVHDDEPAPAPAAPNGSTPA